MWHLIFPRRWDTTRTTRESKVRWAGSEWLSIRFAILKSLSQDIQLDRIGPGLTINAVASIMLAMYQAMAEKRGFDVKTNQRNPAE